LRTNYVRRTFAQVARREHDARMVDRVVLFGVPLFTASTASFVVVLALGIFAYEAAEARARAREDARWLLVSLGFAALATFAIDVEPAGGVLGVAGLVMEAMLGAAMVGVGEGALALRSWLAARRSPRAVEGRRLAA
jgi:hypothetical protein